MRSANGKQPKIARSQGPVSLEMISESACLFYDLAVSCLCNISMSQCLLICQSDLESVHAQM